MNQPPIMSLPQAFTKDPEVYTYMGTLQESVYQLNLDAGLANGGLIPDAKISETSVIQHEGAITHGNIDGLDADDHLQYHDDARALAWLATRTTDDLPEGAVNLYHTSKRAQDAAWGVLGGAQTGIAVTYDDAAGTVDFTVSYVVAGDIETTGSANGLIMESPDGTRWRVTVDDTGALNTAAV